MEAYDSLADAIYYAAQQTAEMGAAGAEYMAGVYRGEDGRYAFLPPIGGDSDRKVKGKIRYPKGAALMALVHNHPEVRAAKERDRNAHEFSLDDIDQARQLGIPSFITFGPDMRILQFEPGKDKPSKPREFDHIPEVQPAGEYLGLRQLVSQQ